MFRLLTSFDRVKIIMSLVRVQSVKRVVKANTVLGARFECNTSSCCVLCADRILLTWRTSTSDDWRLVKVTNFSWAFLTSSSKLAMVNVNHGHDAFVTFCQFPTHTLFIFHFQYPIADTAILKKCVYIGIAHTCRRLVASTHLNSKCKIWRTINRQMVPYSSFSSNLQVQSCILRRIRRIYQPRISRWRLAKRRDLHVS